MVRPQIHNLMGRTRADIGGFPERDNLRLPVLVKAGKHKTAAQILRRRKRRIPADCFSRSGFFLPEYQFRARKNIFAGEPAGTL